MKTPRLIPALALALFSTLDSDFSTALAQGSLTPPGAPAPTMKTLTQIEPRTPISSAPFVIAGQGSYYLTTNVSVSTGNAITIEASGVTLDLNGFTISSTAPSATGDGIQLFSGVRDVTIANGHIRGGVVDSGGVYSGSGFGYGITYALNAPANVLVSHVTVSGCLYYGIYLNTGDSTAVESCTVRTIGSEGIYASTIRDSSATDCGGDAIYGDQVFNCRGQATGSGDGVFASSSANNCYGTSIGGYGVTANNTADCSGNSSGSPGINALSAQNCYGNSSSGSGVSAISAHNCFGSSSTGEGVTVTQNAENCYGISNGGAAGIDAGNVQNSYGASSSGDGIFANLVLNSYGYSSGAGYGIFANVVQNSEAFSSTGIALKTYIANSCDPVTSSGVMEVITYKYNMP